MYSQRPQGIGSWRPGSGPGGRQTGFGGGNFLGAPNRGITRTVDLPSQNTVGLIIGKGGATIKKLQQMDGVSRVYVEGKVVIVQATDQAKGDRCVNEIMLLISRNANARPRLIISVLDVGSRQQSKLCLCFRPYDENIDRHSYAGRGSTGSPFMLTGSDSVGNDNTGPPFMPTCGDDDVSQLAARLAERVTFNDSPSALTTQEITFLINQRIELPGVGSANSINVILDHALHKLAALIGKPPANKRVIPMHSAISQQNALAVELTCRPGNYTFFGEDIKPNTQLQTTIGSRHQMIFSPKFHPARVCLPDWVKSQWEMLQTEYYTTCHVTDCSTGLKLSVRLAVDEDDPLKPLDIALDDRMSPEKKAAIERLQTAITLYEVLDLDDGATISDTTVKKAYRKATVQLHLDKNSFPEATDAFKCLNHAYDILKSEDGRTKYRHSPAGFPVLSIPTGVAPPTKLPRVVDVASDKQKLFSVSTVRVTPGDVGTRWVIQAAELDGSNDTPAEAASRARIIRAMEDAWSTQDAQGMMTCPASDTQIHAEVLKQVKAKSWTDGNFVLVWKHVKERSGVSSCVKSDKYVEIDLWSCDIYDQCVEFAAGNLPHEEFKNILCAHVDECKKLIDQLLN
eukprot:GEMP01029678.1.p1 GENE.GEMP01029678.1~~GEMP01029678.1.p1  ORF type:complete len:626 (+),score=154.91 GEMP01029678.1:100-1977(+)